jgi:hypothetical protein
LKGWRDRIPALRRKGSREGKRPEKISRFCLDRKIGNHIFVVPKEKKRPGNAEALEGKSSLKF